MSRLHRFLPSPLVGGIILSTLAILYTVVYVNVLVTVLHSWTATAAGTVVDHQVDASNSVLAHWTVASMDNAINADELVNSTSTLTQSSVDTNQGKAVKQDGQLPRDSNLAFPLSTVGKIFFTSSAGQDYVCSGTATASANHSVVDTAGHCLYWQNAWVSNFIFCPLYDRGNTPYGCWVARDLEVPADWIDAKPNDLHHDFGMAIVASSSQGFLTDVVGGAGWAYNQPIEQPFYAYGYPAAPPYNGQTRQACDAGDIGQRWQFAGGTVISIPCKMTGGSSGGPWFIQIDGQRYLNGHNDFGSSIQPDHMFSPYYDDTWYALYSKAQQA